jgi:hypothetical protein
LERGLYCAFRLPGVDFLDLGAKGALGEADADGLGGGGLGGGAEEDAFGGVSEGVAAVEDGEGGEGFEAGSGLDEAIFLRREGLGG